MISVDQWDDAYTLDARRVLLRAQCDAIRMGSTCVTPLHILVALASLPSTLGACALKEAGVSTEKLSAAAIFVLRQQHEVGRIQRSRRAIPLRNDARSVLQGAAGEVVSLGDGAIGTIHILLALLCVEGSASQFLARQGVTWQQARALAEHLPRTEERNHLSVEDRQAMQADIDALPDQVAWHIRLTRFTRLYPIPVLLVGIWALYILWYLAIDVVAQLSAQSSAQATFQAHPSLRTWLAIIQARAPIPPNLLHAAVVGGDIFALCLWIVLLTGIGLLFKKDRRIHYRAFARSHILLLGWVAVVVVRLVLGLPTWFGLNIGLLTLLQARVTQAWFWIWIVALVVLWIRNRRNRQTAGMMLA